MVTVFILSILLILIIATIAIYNKLVRNKNRMHEAWSIIDVFLKKRYDLVPSLVNVVKGYSLHEKNVLEQVVRLRSEAMHAKNTNSQITSENELGKALEQLFVTVEGYPELKANQHFLELQHQLSDLEGDLEKARRYYNGTVRENNIYIESFPSNIIAGVFNFSKGIFFNIETAEAEQPELQL